MSRVAGTLIAGVLALASGRAVADSVITLDLSRCPIFAESAATAAIEAELTLPSAQRAKLADVRVTVDCPDSVTASVEVTPAPTGGPFKKHLDLSDLPAELHLRLLTLAVAEMVTLSASTLPDRKPEVTPTEAHRAIPQQKHHVTSPTEVSLPLGRRRSLWGQDTIAGYGFAQVGIRTFFANPDAMLDLAVGALRGPFRIELFAASRVENDSLGALRATLVGIGAAAVIACRGGGGTWLCLSGHSAVGIAAVTTDPSHPMIHNADAAGLFLEAGPRFEVKIEHTRWSGELGLGANWSSGLAALAEDREVLRMSGPVAVLCLTLGWAP